LETENRIEIFREDSRFHLSIAEFSGNKYLSETLRRLDVKVQLCRMIRCDSMDKIGQNVRFHRKLLEAMRGNQGEQAEQLLRQHIGRTLEKSSEE
jgi:DNA-binding GntR family transcriptional regulator